MSPPVVLFIMETNNLTGDKIMQEIWKDIEGYEGCYQISNFGRVKSLERLSCQNILIKERIKKNQDNGNGYKYVQLKLNGTRKNFYVHRLVATYFNFKKDEATEVNHIDGNKENNCSNNLEWVTSSENTKHAIKNGLITNEIQVIKMKEWQRKNRKKKQVYLS